MDDEDYLALIALVETELARSGLSDIANHRHYRVQNEETGDWKLYAPKDHLVALLEAFERHLAINDRAVVEASLDRINDFLIGEDRVKRAVCEIPGDGGSRFIDLAEAPDLSELRQELRVLLNQLRGPGLLEFY
ncbi:hypothetical protein [Sphingobium yanoikuyae]|uniref:hypothetical protein n=1 Tax=Sphingobium yanoikuyae TaxID=13690 RepID=UPI00289FAC32|nr:hypothetical protein [Sphingobium yanoikuyae]